MSCYFHNTNMPNASCSNTSTGAVGTVLTNVTLGAMSPFGGVTVGLGGVQMSMTTLFHYTSSPQTFTPPLGYCKRGCCIHSAAPFSFNCTDTAQN